MIEIDTSELTAYLAGVDAFADSLPDVVTDIEFDAAELVTESARPTVPVRTGRARGSLRTLFLGDSVAAAGGAVAVPYYGWLEFGGDAGRNHSVHRDRVPDGRYLYPAYVREAAEVEALMVMGLLDAARDAGIA